MSYKFVIDAKLIIEMALIKPNAALRMIEQPCLLVHGAEDSMVPVAISRDLARRVPRIRYVEVPGMDHGITDVNDEDGTSEASQRNFELVASMVSAHIRGTR